MTKNILVVGGAGYIGSHTVKLLKIKGFVPIIMDNLSTGHAEAISGEIFEWGDVRNPCDLDRIFDKHKISAVMHFCAKSLVGESMVLPEIYFENNVIGGHNLLVAMLKHDVKKIIFSSTAATFGQPPDMPITEDTEQNPTNPYGESKLIFEKMLKWFDVSHGIKHVILRYFNAAGAWDDGSIGEDHTPETHLLPIIFQVVNMQREYLGIFGDNYNTPDKTCIRDYIHICDLAEAHVLAVKYLMGSNKSENFNLGNGLGFSVKEIVKEVEKVTGTIIKTKIEPRRPGDPDFLVASSAKIQKILGWNPKYSLEQIIQTAMKWHTSHIDGYKTGR